MTKKQSRGDKTKERIIRSAYRLFGKKGYANTGLIEIAKAAKVTTGAIYYHFSDKRGVFEAVCIYSAKDVLNKLLESAGEIRFETSYLEKAIIASIDVVSDDRIQQIITRDAPTLYSREEWRKIEELGSFGILKSGISILQNEGKVSGSNPEILASIFLSVILEAAAEVASAADKEKVLKEAQSVTSKIVRTFIEPG